MSSATRDNGRRSTWLTVEGYHTLRPIQRSWGEGLFLLAAVAMVTARCATSRLLRKTPRG